MEDDTDQGLAKMMSAPPKRAKPAKIEGATLGRYRVGNVLGRGGMGVVYAAEDVSLGREVVVKVINADRFDEDDRKVMLARFRREAMAASRVLHQNVAVIFSFEEIGGRHLLIQERVIGRTLRDELLTSDGQPLPMDPKRAIRVAIGILKGLAAIHGSGIVHRDLKPGNVMLTRDGDRVKILDFGLGKAVEASGDPALDATLTVYGSPAGSPLYMAPEQIESKPVDARTDLYALGIILFHLLTGKPPFIGRDTMAIYDQHRQAPPPPVIGPEGRIHPALEAVVHKAMAKMPDERFGSAEAMRDALEAIDLDAKPGSGRVAIVSAFVFMAMAAGALLAFDVGGGRRQDPVSVTVPAIKAPTAKAVAPAPDGIRIPAPPPPRPAATAAQGCSEYMAGRTSDAIATLTRALAKDPDDVRGLYCLCGSYVRDRILAPDERGTCEAYVRHPSRDAVETKQVRLWLKLPSR